MPVASLLAVPSPPPHELYRPLPRLPHVTVALLAALLGLDMSSAHASPSSNSLLQEGLRPLASAQELGIRASGSWNGESEPSGESDAGERRSGVDAAGSELSWRDQGSAKQLRGQICVEQIFVDDPSSPWSDNKRAQAAAALHAALNYLSERAARKHIAVSWKEHQISARSEEEIPIASEEHGWTAALMSTAPVLGLYLPIASCEVFTCEQRLSVIHVAKVGRSYALPSVFSSDVHDERVVIFARGQYTNVVGEEVVMPELPAAFAHEILHLFGAQDLYQPDERGRQARVLYPNDIMLRTQSQIDELEIDAYTAYTIGWSDLEPAGISEQVTPKSSLTHDEDWRALEGQLHGI